MIIIIIITNITFAEEVVFSYQSECLSVCVQNISKSYEQTLMKFFERVGRPDHDPDAGIFLKNSLFTIVILLDSQE